MIIIEQSYEIAYYRPDLDIPNIAKGYAICYNTPLPEGYEKQCEYIGRLHHADKENPHETPLEHSLLSVIFTTNRGVSHELVRHRVASFNQESTRYCNYSKDKFDGQVKFIMDHKFNNDYENFLLDCEACERAYLTRIKNGHRAEEARGVLNNDVATKIMVSANYREWRHILKLRTSIGAHYQMRELMEPLQKYLANDLPCVFGDLVTETKE